MATTQAEETKNVLDTALVIATVIVVVSIGALWIITHNIYADAYYTLETFFGMPNSGVAFTLADDIFIYRIYTGYEAAAIILIVVIDSIGKLLVISFIIAAVVDMVRYVNIENTFNRIRIRRIKGHVIVCGYNSLAKSVIEKLKKSKMKFVAADTGRENVVELNREGAIAFETDYSTEEGMKDLGVERAGAVLLLSEDDLKNVLSAIAARKINKNVKIIARVSNSGRRAKMLRIGVDMCILPEYLAGLDIGLSVIKEVGR